MQLKYRQKREFIINGDPTVTKPINNSTPTVRGNCHSVLQKAQTSCLGLSFETINNELWHLEGVKTILTPNRV